MRIAEVAYPIPLNRTFDYEVPGELAALKPGMRIQAPFGPRKVLPGLVLSVRDGQSKFKLKPISKLLDREPLMNAEMLALGRWLSARYCAPIGECLKALMPSNLRNAKRGVDLDAEAGKWTAAPPAPRAGDFELTPGQANAVDVLGAKLAAKTFSANLIFGVPASGKTEVYIRLIRQAVKDGGQAMFLVPEIALSRPFFKEFSASLGLPVALWHSQVGAGAKRRVWTGLRSGAVRVVVGPRSAALLPFNDLRLIVMDEEQDESYKQDEQLPFYHARDVVLHRSAALGSTVVLGSATPSIEAMAEARAGRLAALKMHERISKKTATPRVRVLDRPPEKGECLTPELQQAILDRLQKREQVILLVNRRGFSNFIMCRDCAWVARCPECSVAYIHHRAPKETVDTLFGPSGFIMKCHHCGKEDMPPLMCGRCRKNDLREAGVGTQRVVRDLKRRCPYAKVLRMDRDTVSKEKADDETSIYNDFLAGKADVLVGTKLVAKGFHFPKVTLVGIIDADTMLNMPDFRAAERTVQLLIQAAGRAGRADRPGEVILQTANPTHYAIQAVARGDYGAFAELELKHRAEFHYPPGASLIRLLFQAKLEPNAKKAAVAAGKALAADLHPDDELLGPAPGVRKMLQGRYRYHLLLKIRDAARLEQEVARVGALATPSTVKLKVNVDPYDFL